MPCSQTRLTDLCRPRLLVRAARHGLDDYRRDRDLARLIGSGPRPCPGRAVPLLLDLEEDLDSERRAGHATYSAARHIDVLIALMAEARLA